MKFEEIDAGELKRRLRAGRELRGVRLPPATTWPAQSLARFTFTRVDFNLVRILRRIFGGRTRFEQCTFDSCLLEGLVAENVDFVDCRFHEVRIGVRARAILDKCSFLRCTFENSWFENSQAMQTSFVETTFDGVISRLQVTDCEFKKVNLAGRLTDTNFIRCRFEDADLRATTPALMFVEPSMREVFLPSEDGNFFVPRQVLTEVAAAIAPKLSAQGADWLQKLAHMYRNADMVHIYRDLLDQMPNDEAVTVMSELRVHAYSGAVTYPRAADRA